MLKLIDVKDNVYRSHIRSDQTILFYWGSYVTKTSPEYFMSLEQLEELGRLLLTYIQMVWR